MVNRLETLWEPEQLLELLEDYLLLRAAFQSLVARFPECPFCHLAGGAHEEDCVRTRLEL